MDPMNAGNTEKARLIYSDGRIDCWPAALQHLALAVWYVLPRGVRAAFRGAGDARPVYSHDCVDRL